MHTFTHTRKDDLPTEEFAQFRRDIMNGVNCTCFKVSCVCHYGLDCPFSFRTANVDTNTVMLVKTRNWRNGNSNGFGDLVFGTCSWNLWAGCILLLLSPSVFLIKKTVRFRSLRLPAPIHLFRPALPLTSGRPSVTRMPVRFGGPPPPFAP